MPTGSPSLDIAQLHRHFSVECFNRVWKYIDMERRTPADDEAMVLCALASLWHWTQREDCAAKNLSIGHWQVSRVYALLGRGEEAMRYALAALKHAEGLKAFYVGYGHEAVARAAAVMGDHPRMQEHLENGKECAGRVADGEERAALEGDLAKIAP